MVIGLGGGGKMYGGEYPGGINVQEVNGRRAIVLGGKKEGAYVRAVNVWGGTCSRAEMYSMLCIVCCV